MCWSFLSPMVLEFWLFFEILDRFHGNIKKIIVKRQPKLKNFALVLVLTPKATFCQSKARSERVSFWYTLIKNGAIFSILPSLSTFRLPFLWRNNRCTERQTLQQWWKSPNCFQDLDSQATQPPEFHKFSFKGGAELLNTIAPMLRNSNLNLWHAVRTLICVWYVL